MTGALLLWRKLSLASITMVCYNDLYRKYTISEGNAERITVFRYHVMKSLFYCLNQRSQKKSYNWVAFLNMIDNSYPLVSSRVYVKVYE